MPSTPRPPKTGPDNSFFEDIKDFVTNLRADSSKKKKKKKKKNKKKTDNRKVDVFARDPNSTAGKIKESREERFPNPNKY